MADPTRTYGRALVGLDPLDPDVTPPGTPIPAAAVAVFAGGVLGGLAREGLSAAWPGGTVPWAVLTINVLGSLVLGVVAEFAVRRALHRHSNPWTRLLRPCVGTGFCGGFTTFSSLAVALDGHLRDGRPGLALAYLGLSLVLGLLALVVGVTLGRRIDVAWS